MTTVKIRDYEINFIFSYNKIDGFSTKNLKPCHSFEK